MAAATWQLDNLCLIIDDNRMQVEGDVEQVMRMQPLLDKWRAFNWHAVEIDGHDSEAIMAAFDEARAMRGRPTCINARTLVGKGAPSLEGIMSHNIKLPSDVAQRALAEIGGEEA
jgi:transketolase